MSAWQLSGRSSAVPNCNCPSPECAKITCEPHAGAGLPAVFLPYKTHVVTERYKIGSFYAVRRILQQGMILPSIIAEPQPGLTTPSAVMVLGHDQTCVRNLSYKQAFNLSIA
jgi:hypothetical protein